MQPLALEAITVDEIDLSLARERNISLAVLRLDKIHSMISGNKWFKLKYYLQDAKALAKKRVATFGGAFSNHVLAVAAAGKLYGFETTGIIRGERPIVLSHTLRQATDQGMELIFIDREKYRKKELPHEIKASNEFFVINEGGYGRQGVEGSAEILNYCQKENYTDVVCAVGTSTMMAGLVKTSMPGQVVIGVPVLKNNDSLNTDLIHLLLANEREKQFKLVHGYHFGGYAKFTVELITFMNDFYRTTSLPSDFVYTGKLFYAVIDLIKNNFFQGGRKLLVIHSGGLQGNLSLPKGTLIF